MRIALRVLEERAVLTLQMAEEAQRNGRPAAAKLSEESSARSRAAADVLRKAVLEREYQPVANDPNAPSE